MRLVVRHIRLTGQYGSNSTIATMLIGWCPPIDTNCIRALTLQKLSYQLSTYQLLRQIMLWHVVNNEQNIIVGSHGENFLCDAQDLARTLERETGLPHFINTVQSDHRPELGSILPSKK